MENVLDYNILVAEESGILNFDIKKSLKARGFKIIEKAGSEDVRYLIKSKTPDLTIACIRSLTKLMPANDFYEIWRAMININGNTDTIIFDKSMNPLASYPKPFNTQDIIQFINEHIHTDNDHENTI
jgi:hypothetical protein